MEENFRTRNRLITDFGFTKDDFAQIENLGISVGKIEAELSFFKEGIPKCHLKRPAILEDGILKPSVEEFNNWANYFDQKKENLSLTKFVPASGAATRMFKFLNEFRNNFDAENETINAYINRKKDKNLPVFLAGIQKFPFYDAVKSKLKELHSNYYEMESHQKSEHFIKTMLSSEHFDFANKPKGVLDFHKYDTHITTPVEEHINECAFYASSKGISNLHFTVSENHKELFENIVNRVKDKIEINSKTILNISYSFQDKSTDTIAVDLENKPFRDENGKLVFRPGGHGALINNLNNLDSDIVFIKNIDNVIQNHIHEISLYKKALAGILIELQSWAFGTLDAIDKNNLDESAIPETVRFMKERLNIPFSEGFEKYTTDNKINSIKNKLNRPIRVCGMVKNEGEPGGGPFWVSNLNGKLSLQIVESSQVDIQSKEQAEIMAKATHFNPVDLVCGIKDYQGEKFDLLQFVDANAGFIVTKNNQGRELKSYELPGLWNGAMAKWNTVFVEVPLITFNPVKTVNDLLKPAHQPSNEF